MHTDSHEYSCKHIVNFMRTRQHGSVKRINGIPRYDRTSFRLPAYWLWHPRYE